MRFERRIQVKADISYLDWNPPIVLESGNVLVSAVRLDPGRDFRKSEYVLLELDGEGREVRQWLNPMRPYETDGVVVYGFPQSRGVREIPMDLPFGEAARLARDRDGSFATALTSSYDIAIHAPGGAVTARIGRPEVDGPALTRTEEAWADSILADRARQVRSVGGIVPDVAVPQRKPPIDRICFDADRRLWVSLSVDDNGTVATADVYEFGGQPTLHAIWPSDIDLAFGAIRGNRAWGVRRMALGVQRLVLVEFGMKR